MAPSPHELKAPGPPAGDGRRVAMRYEATRPIACRTADGQEFTATLLDASGGDIGFLTDRRVENGALLHVHVHGEGPPASGSVPARVVRVDENGAGGWIVGCALTSTLTDSEVRTVLISPGAKQKNRRLDPRKPPKRGTRIACRKGIMGLGPDLAISLVDLSESGACVVLKAALPIRQEVEVALSAPGCGRDVKVLGHVVWAATNGQGTFRTGIQFQKRLTYANLRDLALG